MAEVNTKTLNQMPYLDSWIYESGW